MHRSFARHVALAVLALSVGPACSSSDEPPKVSAAASATAGRVLAVAGKVTVGAKQLAMGDAVGADDVIDTGPDGSVTLLLAHNLARWELGPGKHVRVRESLAWNQPKAVTPVEVEHATASAGRPAERSAAGTVATGAANQDRAPAEATENAKSATPVVPPKPITSGGPGATNDSLGGGDGATGGLGLTGTGKGGGGVGEGTIGIGSVGTIGKGGGGGTGAGYGTGAGRLGSSKINTPTIKPGAAQVQGSLPSDVIRRIVRTRFGHLRLCYEKGLQANPALAGRVSVKFTIDKNGSVPSAQDAGSTLADVTVVMCMVGVFKAMEFPKPTDGIVVVTYPIVFGQAE